MWNRRDFARSMSLLAATSLLARPVAGAASVARLPIKPKRLSPGDTVGLILPASGVAGSDSIALAREQLEAIGFKVKVGRHAHDRWGYFAGRDRDRADDVNQMFADEGVAGIVCYTGGWGTPRILPYIDYDLIARKPKVIIGYSDITSLLNAITRRTGLVTFHGPVGGSNIEPYSLENMRRVIMTAEPAGLLRPPDKKPSELVDRTNRVIRLAPGKASGRLVGGNLTMLSATMGTPWEIDTAGAILFLEDIREEVYRIDRMLSQLALAGKLDRVAGVIFGRCTQCESEGGFSLEEVLRDRFGSLGIPALSGLPIGHIEQKLTIPIGLSATLDADAGTLTLNEAAVT